jgi:hypothetical protein
VNEQSDKHEDKKPHEITIHIDGKEFKVEQDVMTGAELRRVPTPPIGPERDLFFEGHGGEDKLIEDEERVELKNGMHFFSVERNINPGA